MKSMQIFAVAVLTTATVYLGARYMLHHQHTHVDETLYGEMEAWLTRRMASTASCHPEVQTVEAARYCVQANDDVQALRLAQIIAAQDASHHLDATILLGELAWHSGHLSQARDSFKKVASDSQGRQDVRAEALVYLAALEEEVGDMDAARKAVEKAADLAQSREMNTRVATQLASIFHNQGELKEAASLLEQPSLVHDTRRLAELASVQHDMAKVNIAAEVMTEALSLDEAGRSDSTFQDAALILAALGNPHGLHLLKSFSEIQQDNIRASLLNGGSLTHRRHSLAYTYLRIAEMLRPTDARAAYEYATLSQQSFTETGIVTPGLAEAFNTLGNAAADLELFDEAQDSLSKALDAFEASVGARSTKTAAVMGNLATVFQQLHIDDVKVEELYLRAANIQTALDAPNDAAASYQNLAVLYYQNGRIGDAHDMSKRAVDTVVEAGLPESNPDLILYRSTLAQLEKIISQHQTGVAAH